MTFQKHKRPSAFFVLVMALAMALLATACSGGDSKANDAKSQYDITFKDIGGEKVAVIKTTEELTDGQKAAVIRAIKDLAEDEAEATPEEMDEADETTEDEAEATPEEMDEADEAMVNPETEGETEDQLIQADLDCQSAQDRVGAAHRDVSNAYRAQASAYVAHIEAHDSEMNVQGSYDEVVEVAVLAEQAVAAATRAQTLAIQACDGTVLDVYEGQARCASSEQNLSAAEQIHVDRLAALHDAHNQSAPEIEVVQAEVNSAWAKIELAEAEVDRDCPNSG